MKQWTELDVMSLPKGELDSFERKGGALFNDEGNLRNTLGKALSALSNSGGGHIVLGINDKNEIDGAPEVFKGRQRTREWLERIISHLVAPPLQDFNVYDVVPDNPSSIPHGRTVIVIDVGKSNLAPHQDLHTKHYFHRVGSNSLPAPHHVLELLWTRARYPSQKIAHAWLNFVIAPLLVRLERESEILNNNKLQWDHQKKSLTNLEPFYVTEDVLSPNQVQFLDAYPGIKSQLEAHDYALRELTHKVVKLAREIKRHERFRRIYVMSINSASLNTIRNQNKGVMNFGGDPDMVSSIFGSWSESDRLGLIAQHVINNEGDLHRHYSLWPLWNHYKNDFRSVMSERVATKQTERLHEAQSKLLMLVYDLLGTIKTIRRELALKFGEVFEDETLNYQNRTRDRLALDDF